MKFNNTVIQGSMLLVALLLSACGGGSINLSPVANAGPAQNVTTGSLVTLDGSASSDANGNPLTYSWVLTSRPASSAAALTGATTVAPTFTADVAGTYVATLVVNDGLVNSKAASVTITAAAGNSAPVADAGTAQNVTTGSLVTLNGSASSDANGNPLTYSWALTSRPASSAAALTGATTVAPTFTADLAGTYVATLVVNDGWVNSTAATVTITAAAGNSAPVANAGPVQNISTSTLVTLNGSASSDADGDPLTYSWTLTSAPASSAAALTGATTVAPTFTADLAGTYVATLVVNDGLANSAAATVTITAATGNSAPVAHAGAAQNVTIGALVTLNGSASSDANGDPLTYSWTLTSAPASSTAALTGATTVAPTFTADMAGAYVATLVVNDGLVNSTAATVTITAQALPLLNDTGASQCYQAASDVLGSCAGVGATGLNPAQDGMVGRDANAATNDSADGALGFSYTNISGGDCVQDNVTGLMWEVKTADGGLRDWTKTYSNIDSTAQIWIGASVVNPTQADIDASTNSIGFKNSVNAQGLCGYHDWRLPTADELQSIVNYGVAYPGPAIDTTWFPNTHEAGYWSASSAFGVPSNAWSVNFSNGVVGQNIRGYNLYVHVRLVRAGQTHVLPRYTVSANGQEVTDNQTNLIWRRCVEGMSWNGATCVNATTTCANVSATTPSTFTHEEALQCAAAQSGSAGWRLPNVKELASISDRSLNTPAIDATAFPATPVNAFWSATPFVGDSYAWDVEFTHGAVSGSTRDSYEYVRLVRTAQ